MKQKLQAQLHDCDLRNYLLEREDWNEETFNKISWEAYATAFRRLSRNRRTATSKACYNLWHTGVRHQFYYHEVIPCYMCHNQVEYWRHVILCPSLDAALNRPYSWSKVKKSMERWKLPNDLWVTVEKGMLSYTEKSTKAKVRPSPTTPFPPTFNNQRNSIKLAFRAQSVIGWEKIMKGRLTGEWTTLVRRHYENNGYKLKAADWTPTFIGSLWDHMCRIWKF
jgi:hypothetical protein